MNELFLRRVVSKFPRPLRAACGYGSGVLAQGAGQEELHKKMVDFLFVVDSPNTWHAANLQCHRNHYSFLGYTGASALSRIQEAGPGVYFNTLVPMEGRLVKYGVVSTAAAVKDLTEWRWLYLAGRLQKPVHWIVQPDEYLFSLVQHNLCSTAAATLLLLGCHSGGHSVSQGNFFRTLTELSYSGDVRQGVAEDRHKVANIVSGQMSLFTRLYRPALGRLGCELRDGQVLCGVDTTVDILLHQLPREYQLPASSTEQQIVQHMTRTIRATVRKSSVQQTGKSALTAGLWKSVIYGGQKVIKMGRSLLIS